MAFDFGKITDTLKGATENFQIDKVFTNDFMASNTKFATIKEFIAKAGITPDSLKDLVMSDDSTLNKFVADNTKFANLKEMYQTAISKITKK